jgi:hypothetical protein
MFYEASEKATKQGTRSVMSMKGKILFISIQFPVCDFEWFVSRSVDCYGSTQSRAAAAHPSDRQVCDLLSKIKHVLIKSKLKRGSWS